MTDQCAWYSYSRKCYHVLIFVWDWEHERLKRQGKSLPFRIWLMLQLSVHSSQSGRFGKRSLQPPGICSSFLFDLLCQYTNGTVCESVWGSRHWVRVGAESTHTKECYFWLLDTRQFRLFHCRLSCTANGWRCARAHTHTHTARPTPTTHTTGTHTITCAHTHTQRRRRRN